MVLHFLVPGDINTLTGGYVYDKIIIEGLQKLGYTVVLHELPGEFPFPTPENIEKCEAIFAGIPAGELIFIDSLALGPMYKVLERQSDKNPVIAIMHLPLPKNPNFSSAQKKHFLIQEKIALNQTAKIVAVSKFTSQLILDYGIETSKIVVITPGVSEEMPRKTTFPTFPQKLLCVGSYLPGKGQLLLTEALTKLKDLTWTLTMYGIQNFDTEYVQEIKQKVKSEHLTDRIFLNPQVSGDELIAAYQSADLFILPSYFENFSMALNDALYSGIPVITTDGGGIPFSVPHDMGVFVQTGDVNSLKKAIFSVLTDKTTYRKLYTSASAYRKTATSWQKSIEKFHNLISNLIGREMIFPN